MAWPSENVKAVKDSLTKYGFTNPYLVNGILAVVGKESEFIPRAEKSYANTSNARIRAVFGSRLQDFDEDELTALKKNDVAFFNQVYGGRYGNTAPGDAYAYRGRGFNQITFKNLYRDYGNKIGVDLVNSPEKLNDTKVAADALAAYFKDQFDIGKKTGYLESKIGVKDVSEIKDLDTAVKAAVQANAGWKTSFQNAVVQEGYKKALEYVALFPIDLLEKVAAPIIRAAGQALKKKG